MADLASAYSSSGQTTVCTQPLGDRTTVLDIADRDEMDTFLFPLTSENSMFTRDASRRTLPFTPVVQEFSHIGTAEFGGRLVFEIGSVKACDLLFSVALQIRLGHWLPDSIIELLQASILRYKDPEKAWIYANSLGTVLIESAELQLNDQILERIDSEFTLLANQLLPDINTNLGLSVDAYGAKTTPPTEEDAQLVFPTSNQTLFCILPFSFQRIRRREGFPLVSVKEGSVRISIQLRPFSEVVRMVSMNRSSCNETPLEKTFEFENVKTGVTTTVVASKVIPPFQDVRLVTYGMFVDGKYRDALLRAPFDRMYREVQSFRFTEPLKYSIASSDDRLLRVQLPLELNHPVEEIWWVVRRSDVRVNNEWTNTSGVLESEENPIFNPKEGLLAAASLQINGETIVEGSGDFFRQQIAEVHRGGIVPYSNYIYGYSFARKPGHHDPSGSINTSRSTDIRLRLDVSPPDSPGPGLSSEWEVLVYALAINWVRFDQGIANRVFSS